MSTIVITAGRNIGAEPMADSSWSDLRHQISATLTNAGAIIYTHDAIGSGQWTDAHGVTIKEESVTYVGSIEDAVLDSLTRNISRIASQFNQDAIALIVGQSHLIEGK
jgi:hypothetical protein